MSYGLRHKGGPKSPPKHESRGGAITKTYGPPDPVLQSPSVGSQASAAGYDLQGLTPPMGRLTRQVQPLDTHEGRDALEEAGKANEIGFRYLVRFDGV